MRRMGEESSDGIPLAEKEKPTQKDIIVWSSRRYEGEKHSREPM